MRRITLHTPSLVATLFALCAGCSNGSDTSSMATPPAADAATEGGADADAIPNADAALQEEATADSPAGLDGQADAEAGQEAALNPTDLVFVSPSDGDLVDNPVTFRVAAGSAIQSVRYLADTWELGSGTDPTDGFAYTYSFTPLLAAKGITFDHWAGYDTVEETTTVFGALNTFVNDRMSSHFASKGAWRDARCGPRPSSGEHSRARFT